MRVMYTSMFKCKELEYNISRGYFRIADDFFFSFSFPILYIFIQLDVRIVRYTVAFIQSHLSRVFNSIFKIWG